MIQNIAKFDIRKESVSEMLIKSSIPHHKVDPKNHLPK